MKIILLKKSQWVILLLILIGTFTTSRVYCEVDKTTGLPVSATNNSDMDISFQKILNSVQMASGDVERIQDISYQYNAQKRELIKKLLETLKNAKASNLNRGMAAYYLGEAHAAEAINALANNITLKIGVEPTSFYSGLPLVSGFTARNALIKIGNLSVPAMLQNIAESDDTKVRELSLEVIQQIDNDKDISQLRLQKAIKAEMDTQKQARLQAALKALG
jgi:hypothetical protein